MNVIRQKGQIDHYWRWQMWLARGRNMMMLEQQINTVQQKLLHVLMAVNKEYYFGFKWLDVVLSKLVIAPKDFAERFKGLGDLDGQEKALQLTQLVEETYELVEVHVPGVNVERLRSIFRWQRPIWDAPPPIRKLNR